MPLQLIFDFTTTSPVNIDRLTGQNKRLYDWLAAGNIIHCLHPAKRELRIGYINSRASDLIHRHNVPICKEWIKAVDTEGNLVSVIQYSLTK